MRLMSKAFFSCGERISPADFLKRIQNDPRSVILDVRSTEEFAEGAVRGAVHIPDYKIEEEIQKKIPDRTTPIYVYCYSGVRAESAVQQMRVLGYVNVFNMGGFMCSGFVDAFPPEKPAHSEA